jgi:trk system potassium uptake protein TrkH
MLEWLGGIGIVVMALTVMTELRIGGLELFQSESSDKSEKLLPRVRQIAKTIFTLYIVLTILCFTALYLAGMRGFDAFCHTLTCVSTGGFSNYDDSIGHFNNPAIELIIIIFMFIGGCSQLLFARTFFGKSFFIIKDSQFKAYVKGILLVILATMAWRLVTTDTDPIQVVIKTLFNITAIFTTTGYISEDYTTWGPFAIVLFFFLPFIGGCTGSTTGGIKIYRFQVLWSIAETQLKKLRRPHGVFIPKFNGKRLSEDLFSSVAGFVILFILSFVGLALVLAILGVDFLTSMSASASVLTNLGPGLGDIIGPTGNYGSLSENVKWCLMIGMIMGRLELLTIYVLFLPSFWKD